MTSGYGDYFKVQQKEFSIVFRKHLIFGVFDKINYEKILNSFFKVEFKEFRKRLANELLSKDGVTNELSEIVRKIEGLLNSDEEDEDFNGMDIEENGQAVKVDKRNFLDEKRWNVIINSHIKLDIHDTILLHALEDFFAEELEDFIKTIMLDNDAAMPILPIVNFFYETYVKRF